jgi:hypothetical protein
MTATREASVGDDEILYRRVKAGRDHYVNRDGVIRVTPLAFYHRSFAISVNRASLCTDGARDLIEEASDGILELIAGAVRAWHHEIEAVTFRGEVTSSPLPENPAHADIYVIRSPDTAPPASEKKAFRRFCDYLAVLATNHWAIEPPDSVRF